MHTANQEKPFKQKILTAVTVPEVLTRSQCEMIIRDAEVIGMKRAPVLAKATRQFSHWSASSVNKPDQASSPTATTRPGIA